jgi:WG containing repeat
MLNFTILAGIMSLIKTISFAALVILLTRCGSTGNKSDSSNDSLQRVENNAVSDTQQLVETNASDSVTPRSDSIYYPISILSLFNPAAAIVTNPDSIYVFQGSSAKYGFKNKFGKIIIRPKFDIANNFFGNHAAVILNGKHGFCDTSGKVTWLKNHLFAYHISELSGETYIVGDGQGLIAVTDKNNKYGFMNYSGEIVIPCKYDKAQYFSEGFAAVLKNGKFGFIDHTGKTVIDHKYDDVNFFSNNRACVKIGEKLGYINKKGELVIPAIYGHTYYFSEGLAYTTKSDEHVDYYYIDTTGKTVIKGLFENASPFKNGKAEVQKNGKCLEINTVGKTLKYTGVHCFEGC